MHVQRARFRAVCVFIIGFLLFVIVGLLIYFFMSGPHDEASSVGYPPVHVPQHDSRPHFYSPVGADAAELRFCLSSLC